ncbi:MAG: hypothetical protein JO232_22185 [Verrucomicrobia bacterium]|nr:hypothetical protein [Verrucomicrobiota bacterium]
MPFPISFIASLENRLSEFVTWGESKGIKFHESRVLKYIELLRCYRDALERGRMDDLIESRGAAYLDQIHLEIAELIYLYESLRNFKDSRLKTRFQTIIRGPELLQEDVTGDSRDTQFELQIAALLFRVEMSELRFDGRHDLVCSLDQNPLIIECKRPRKDKTLKESYAKAAYQIETSDLFAENPNTRGIVALDLTQIVVPVLTGTRLSSLKEMEKAFLEELMRGWRGLQITISDYSDKVSGVHLFCQALFYLIDRDRFSLSIPSQHGLVVINTKDHPKNEKIANTYAGLLKGVSNASSDYEPKNDAITSAA